MAGNKFATMLQRNTNRTAVILVYAILEWILIILLLLNSLFTYSISKFASYFGLKPPCLWCSRVDHIFNSSTNRNSYSDLLCEHHATEISKLSYCSSHLKLADTRTMCNECLTSRSNHNDGYSIGVTRRIAFISWVRSSEKLENDDDDDNGVGVQQCSCCNENLMRSKDFPPFLIYKSNDNQEDIDDDDEIIGRNNVGKESYHSDCKYGGNECFQIISDVDSFGLTEGAEENSSNLLYEEKQVYGGEKDWNEDLVNCSCDDEMQFCSGEDQLVETIKLGNENKIKHGLDRIIPVELIDFSTTLKIQDGENGTCDSEPEKDIQESDLLDPKSVGVDNEHEKMETVVDEVEDSSVPNAEKRTREIISEEFENVTADQEFQTLSIEDKDVKAETVDESYNFADQKSEEKNTKQEKDNLIDQNQEGIINSETNEAEAEEKSPETPTSVDTFQYLHKKLLLFEKKELFVEESLDISVSNMDGCDPLKTIDQLKSALMAERKALAALYTELEEERSASAIAANQTMAMITRLQEEKAAMQMEALQYQRMMEEQSEYDQEALQLLNELMVKREKEKQELEKELEIYREKVMEYEMKEKMTSMRDSEDIDEISSIDLNREVKEEEEGDVNLEETALECVRNISALDESLTEFEEERLSILDQLKVLEAKLLVMEEIELVRENNNVNDYDENHNFDRKSMGGDNEISSEEEKSMASMAKRLLPLLDAAENDDDIEIGDTEYVEKQNDSCDLDEKKQVIIEEVDHVYERLQALEADREFLQHCMRSVKKGDKGMDLLQEILQHLRDLKAVELRVQNFNDNDALD